jgi:hypothetical protein
MLQLQVCLVADRCLVVPIFAAAVGMQESGVEERGNLDARVVLCLFSGGNIVCTAEVGVECGLCGVNDRGRAAIRVGTRLVLNKHAINRSSSINARGHHDATCWK